MAKYTVEQKAELKAAGERLGLTGKISKKLVNINERGTKAKSIGVPKDQIKKHRETRDEFLVRMLATYKVKPLIVADIKADYDVTNSTRYQEVEMWNAGSIAQQNILNRYQFSMKPQGITPGEMRSWREHYLLMSREQLAAVIRVTERTVSNWEEARSPIPFSMWWMMHTTLQDPVYFLTRPGFHDFYIEYEKGEALLCSHKHPEIRYSTTDLYFNRAVFSELLSYKNKLTRADAAYAELEAENTRLREMYKTNAVTKELEFMHDHISQLMKRLNTADVIPFQLAKSVVTVAKISQKTA